MKTNGSILFWSIWIIWLVVTLIIGVMHNSFKYVYVSGTLIFGTILLLLIYNEKFRKWLDKRYSH